MEEEAINGGKRFSIETLFSSYPCDDRYIDDNGWILGIATYDNPDNYTITYTVMPNGHAIVDFHSKVTLEEFAEEREKHMSARQVEHERRVSTQRKILKDLDDKAKEGVECA